MMMPCCTVPMAAVICSGNSIVAITKARTITVDGQKTQATRARPGPTWASADVAGTVGDGVEASAEPGGAGVRCGEVVSVI
ncbi:hypothetical protein GCM10007073_14640 [Micrococcus flavus]|nr:hypothetical protein GCM10007073_14640 [Micrococcus flavus]